MITLSTTTNNDLHLDSSNSIPKASGIFAVLKTCEYAIQTMYGELVLQGDTGVPNFSLIWNGNPNIPQSENAIREVLLSVDGVSGVTSLTVFVENGVLKYNATIQTIYGEASLGL